MYVLYFHDISPPPVGPVYVVHKCSHACTANPVLHMNGENLRAETNLSAERFWKDER